MCRLDGCWAAAGGEWDGGGEGGWDGGGVEERLWLRATSASQPSSSSSSAIVILVPGAESRSRVD